MARSPLQRVLVADDHAFVRKSLEFLLKGKGIDDITIAENGNRAMQLIETADPPFDLIFCDLVMPEEDGLVCLRRVAGLDRRPAVVLMSGDDKAVLESAESLAKRQGLSILGTIEKPLTADKLNVVLAHFGGRRPRRQNADIVRLTTEDIGESLNKGWFTIFFQPQIEVNSQRVCGLEALVRLNHPDHGLLSPASFVDAAERSGQINEITDFVVGESLAWAHRFRDAGHAVTVAINLSAKVLHDVNFPDRMLNLARKTGVPSNSITCELTETVVSGDQTVLLDIMTRLRMKRFRLSIDDFGTGYSSLQQLHGLPFHELKVDKQFVQDVCRNKKSRSIFTNSVRLASDLGLTTVAEGVETEEALILIRKLGCTIAQGYYIARPMPADEVLSWLNRWTATET